MERLSQRDLRSVMTFLEGCYAIHDFEAFIHHVLTALPAVLPADFLTYNEMCPTQGQSKDWLHPADAQTLAMVPAWAQHMHEHPVLMHVLHTHDQQAMKIADFLSRRAYHRLGVYNEVYRPLGVDGWLGIGIPTTAAPPLVLGIALHRSLPDFSERERLILNLLRPHLVQAHHNAMVVTQLQEALTRRTPGFEHLEHGVMVLSNDGQVRMTNTSARHCMATYFGHARSGAEHLPDPLQRWVRHQQAQLHRVDDAPPPRTPLTVERNGNRLVIRLLTGREESLLLLEEASTTAQPASAAFGTLTPRERAVLAWLRQGKTNAEIATLLAIRLKTVKKHLEHIYQKLGVENRTTAAVWAQDALDRSD